MPYSTDTPAGRYGRATNLISVRKFVFLVLLLSSSVLQAQIAWDRDAQNPLIGWSQGFVAVVDVQVVHDSANSLYRMFFTASTDTSPFCIYTATSTNLATWSINDSGPVLFPGAPGAWDDGSVQSLFVMPYNGGFLLYYWGSHNGLYQTGAATSPDGLVWTKYPGNPVLSPGAPGSWEINWLAISSVIFENGEYHMWYGGGDDNSITRTGYAIGTDPFHWTKYAGNPVFVTGPPGSWDAMDVKLATIYKRDGYYCSIYNATDQAGHQVNNAGLAYSTDGINWTRYPGNPVFQRNTSGWDNQIVAPNSTVIVDSTLHLFYAGKSSGQVWQIGHATSRLLTMDELLSGDPTVVAFWHFDEGAGTILHDSSMYHNDGTIHNCEWVPGIHGSALHFDGLTSYVYLPNSSSLRTTGNFTIEAWISLDTLKFDYAPPPDKGSASVLGNFGAQMEDGGYGLGVVDEGATYNYRNAVGGSYSTPTVPIPLAKHFYHLAVTYHRDESDISSVTIVKTYLDGVLKDSSVFAGRIQYNNANDFYIGTVIHGRAVGGWGVREFPGIIDEIRISNVVRAPSEFGMTRVAVSPSRLAFGTVEVGKQMSREIILSNSSSQTPVGIDSVTSSSTTFTVDPATFTIPPQISQPVAVTYAPLTAGSDSGLITFYTDNPQIGTVTIEVQGKGYIPDIAPHINVITDIPDDQGRQIRVRWYQSLNDTAGSPVPVTAYSLWRRVNDPAPGTRISQAADAMPGSIIRMPDQTLWDFIVTVPAVHFGEYAVVAPTLRNSMPGLPYWSVFCVGAQLSDGTVAFSPPDSGCSVDNIFPPPPLALTAVQSGGSVLLSWATPQAPDLREYRIYRSSSPHFNPSDATRISVAHGNSYRDSNLTWYLTYYYLVTAVDSSGNESGPSNTAVGTPGTAVLEPGAAPKEYLLNGNYPNPFNPVTTISYGVPFRSLVRLTVYNTLGQAVGVLVNGIRDAGYYREEWNSGGYPSGVYFARFDATSVYNPSDNFTAVRKMMLMK